MAGEKGSLDWSHHASLFNSHTLCLEVYRIQLLFMLFQLNSNFPLKACFCPPSNLLKAHGLQQSCECPSSRFALLHHVQMPWQSPSFSVDHSAYVTCQDGKLKTLLSFPWISTERAHSHTLSRSVSVLFTTFSQWCTAAPERSSWPFPRHFSTLFGCLGLTWPLLWGR